MVEVIGSRRGKEVAQEMYTIYDSREIYKRFSTVNVDVALPATTTALMIARRELKLAGVFAPECLPPEPILADLSKKGMKFQEKIIRVL
jgi:saccharopine dehydrogenase-like NADP-dependent oxidoreductase